MNYDDERTNRVTSLVLLGMLVAFLTGGLFGSITMYLIK